MFRDINGNKFRTRWISEFCGFVWGEGYVGIVRYTRKEKTFYRGQVTIQLRDDDLPILEEIKSKLGGHVWKAQPRKVRFIDGKEYVQHQTYGWISIKGDELRRIVKLLESGMFPSKKKRNVKILKKYLKIVNGSGIRITDENKEKIRDLRKQILEANSYKE